MQVIELQPQQGRAAHLLGERLLVGGKPDIPADRCAAFQGGLEVLQVFGVHCGLLRFPARL